MWERGGRPPLHYSPLQKEVNDFTNKLSKTAVVSFSLCLNNSTILAKYCCSAAIWSLQSCNFSQNFIIMHFIFQSTFQRDVFELPCLKKNSIFSKWSVYKSTLHLNCAAVPCAIIADFTKWLIELLSLYPCSPLNYVLYKQTKHVPQLWRKRGYISRFGYIRVKRSICLYKNNQNRILDNATTTFKSFFLIGRYFWFHSILTLLYHNVSVRLKAYEVNKCKCYSDLKRKNAVILMSFLIGYLKMDMNTLLSAAQVSMSFALILNSWVSLTMHIIHVLVGSLYTNIIL